MVFRRSDVTTFNQSACKPRAVPALLVLALAISPAAARAGDAGVDADASQLLKRMTDYLGSLPQFGLETSNVVEVVLDSGQKLQPRLCLREAMTQDAPTAFMT